MKQNKKLLIITSLVALLPILAGLLLWDTLPDAIVTHWNFSGEPDGWMGKTGAVVLSASGTSGHSLVPAVLLPVGSQKPESEP